MASKFDTDINLVLVDIPLNFYAGSSTISTVQYVNEGVYNYQPGGKGLITEFNALTAPSTVSDWINSLSNNIPSVPSLANYTIGGNVSNISNLINSVNRTIISNFNIASVATNVLDSVVTSGIEKTTDNLASIAGLIDAGISDKSDSAISLMNGFVSTINQTRDTISNYISSNDIYMLASNKVRSVINNIDTSMNYTDFLLNSAPNIALAIAEEISQYYIENLDIARKNFFYGYEKFAGKRIGMTNFIDIYTARETLKTVKELKVNVYDRIFNAITESYLKYVAVQYDLIKGLNEYALEVNKYYVSSLLESMRSLAPVYESIIRMFGVIIDTEGRVISNKYNLAVGLLTDLYRSASSISGQVIGSITDVASNADRISATLDPLPTQISNDNALKLMDARNSIGSYVANLINLKYKHNSYMFDRALEFYSATAGYPNTVNREMSKFERMMATTSLIMNSLSTVGSAVLPFL